MNFVALGMEHEGALADFLADFQAAGEAEIPAYFPDHSADHADAVRSLAAWSRGDGLQPGWVPCSTWFVEEGDALLGVANLRHALTPALEAFGGHIGYSVRPSARGRGVGHRCLAGAMAGARGLGIERVLLTCDHENAPSCAVIERAGGRLWDEAPHAATGRLLRRYWIELR